MNVAQVLFTAVVYGITLRVLRYSDNFWLTAEGLAKVLEYRSTDTIGVAYSRNRIALEAHSIKAKIDGEGWELRLFDEAGVRYLCEYSKRPGAFHLRRWLDAGGMTASGVTAPDLPLSATNVVALKALASTPPACQVERRKAYCRELLKTLLRYTTGDEAEELMHVIEGEVRDLLSHRHCPGLNDARYDVYRRFWLQGGAV
ncbi:MAG: hypothetical protein I8H73_07140 [Pseudomonadales bacterium]|nr:hypothetical protein [Pseudomonadales bacterium]